MHPEPAPVHSHAPANREFVAAFGRYMEARGFAATTQKEYGDAASRYVESLRTASAIDATRADVRMFLDNLCARGLSASSISKYTFGLRSFYKFLRLAGVAQGVSPTVTIPNRKLHRRLPRVLTVEEIEKLIAAAESPFERAVIEVLYSTGVRVSELVSLKLEDVDMAEHVILVKKGKGRKDRYVLFGQHAAKAIADYLSWRPSKEFLFEAPARDGCVYKPKGCNSWHACFYVNKVQRDFSIFGRPKRVLDVAAIAYLRSRGRSWREITRIMKCRRGTPQLALKTAGQSRARRPCGVPPVSAMLTRAQARREFERIASKIPGFEPVLQRPYRARSIDLLLSRVGSRAKLGRIHPHALRRAMACHLLQNGANLRVVQDLLGHERIMTTQLYTYLSANDLKKVHERCHPHEKGE